MITKSIWEEYKFEKNDKWYIGGYVYSSENITKSLIVSIILTPFTIIFDILISPFELCYYLCLKKIKKDREEK